jgi:CspA family cold shock protein
MITPDGSAVEIGVACSDIAAEGFKILYEGQRVMFEVAQTRKGPAAKNVTSRDQD